MEKRILRHCDAHDRRHVHGPNCGHARVPHDDHFDYRVGDHLHHVDGRRCRMRALPAADE